MTASTLITSTYSDESTALADRLRKVLVTVRTPAGGGSGTAWSEDGLIVTNHHVVPGETATVILDDDTELEATVAARDPEHDLALLRVNAKLTAAEPGDSANLRPGELVFAIGNPWGLRRSLTSGIVLSKDGAASENEVHVPHVIRADLRLAPGNSGGPMTDALGRVVGINSMISGGMAVAIPVNTVLRFIREAAPGERGFLGVTIQPVQVPHAIAASYEIEDEAGLMLTAIEPGSAAELAGLLPGDVVLGIGPGRRGLRHLERPLRSMRAGQKVDLALLRGGLLFETHATPAPVSQD